MKKQNSINNKFNNFNLFNMNKKRFLNLAVCSLLLAGTPIAVTSCKDYDDDITSINSTTDGLSKQLESLQTALKAAEDAAAAAANDVKVAQSAAEKAQQSGDAAAQAAAEAKADAAAAAKAANEAKAEAIKAAMAEVEKLQASINNLNSLTDEQAKELAALSGKINGIELELSKIDLTEVNNKIGANAKLISDLNTQLTTIQTQLNALNNYKGMLEELSKDLPSLKEKISKIDGLVGELNTLKGTVSTLSASVKTNTTNIGKNKEEIEKIQKELKTISTTISTSVSNAVNTIAATMTQRLTSVTLIPDLYVDGIPTISFESAKYTKKVLKNGKWVAATGAKSSFIVSNNTTEATYRLNPGTIKDGDIKISEMAYLSQIATTRAAEVPNDIVNVASATVGDNGRLTVKLGKGNTESLNLADGKIYTVSLKVPIADKHLFKDQGETEASVYSEYTRLEETYFTPELAFVPGEYADSYNSGHLYPDSTTLYSSAAGAKISKNLVYNKSYDLNELVQGCQLFSDPVSHKPFTLEQLKGYGMEINYYVATQKYTPTTPDKTDEQQFVKLSGEHNATLTPVTSSGVSGNEAIIGRQPIIRAELVDVKNGNRVDVGYFKVKFTKEDMADVKIDWTDIATAGTPCQGAEYKFTWKAMAERILEKLENGSGMSKEDFTKIYGNNFTVIPANDANGTLDVNVIESNTDASTPVMTWTVTPEQLGKLKVGDNNTATFTKTVTFTDPSALHPNVVISLKWVVTTKVSDLTLGKTDALKWQNNTMKVYVKPMPVPYDGTTTADYATNILEGRLKPYVSGLLACGKYDIDYAVSGNPAYVGKPLAFETGFGHWQMTLDNQANLKTVTYSIDNNAAGKKLASDGGTIKIDWSSDINGIAANRYVFASMNLQVLPILKLQTTAAKGITDDSHVVAINVTDNIRINDAYGHLVAETATAEEPLAADYWKFYGITEVKYGTDIMIADSADGKTNRRTPASLNMTANIDTTGQLSFQNNGAPLQANAYLMVPVTITHKWGELTGEIAVPLSMKAGLRKARR